MAPGGSAGKALRPALALLSARSAGASAERAAPAAVAVELVHNFSLLHDDIMDGDIERRHRPTAWTVFGVGPAILAGDALLALAQDILLETPPYGVWAARCLSAAVQRLIAGQGSDLAFERRDDVQVEECLEMAGDKTAALMACACSIGVIYLGAPASLAMSLSGFGAHAGLAFQLTDDLLGIWGAPEVTGKPVGSDLRARKKSVPVVAALTSGTDAGARPAGAAGQARAADGGRGGAGHRPGREGGRQAAHRGDGGRGASVGAELPAGSRDARGRAGRSSPPSRSSSRRGNGDRRALLRTRPRGCAAAGSRARSRSDQDGAGPRHRHLTNLQDPAGWWQGELETNVTMDAEDLLLREFLGIRTEEETQAAARWIRRSRQRADGTWANFHGGDADLSTTVEAYVALRLAGDAPESRAHGAGGEFHPGTGWYRGELASSPASGLRSSASGLGTNFLSCPRS